MKHYYSFQDTFDYPELEGHESLCNHLAPKLKGRPRGKRKIPRPDSPYKNEVTEEDSVTESDASACSVEKVNFSLRKWKCEIKENIFSGSTKTSNQIASEECKSSSTAENQVRVFGSVFNNHHAFKVRLYQRG